MALGSSGFYTNGLFIANVPDIGRSALIPADTEYPNGSSPQTVGVPMEILSQRNRTALGITAHAGGTQAAAFQLDYGVSEISVVATGADSVKLPFAHIGSWCYLRNDGANSMTVYGNNTDTIDGVASATGNAQAAAKGKLYFCIQSQITVGGVTSQVGQWVSLLGA